MAVVVVCRHGISRVMRFRTNLEGGVGHVLQNEP